MCAPIHRHRASRLPLSTLPSPLGSDFLSSISSQHLPPSMLVCLSSLARPGWRLITAAGTSRCVTAPLPHLFRSTLVPGAPLHAHEVRFQLVADVRQRRSATSTARARARRTKPGLEDLAGLGPLLTQTSIPIPYLPLNPATDFSRPDRPMKPLRSRRLLCRSRFLPAPNAPSCPPRPSWLCAC
ncbi:hypothetical protein BD414DRAFT_93369 [Trametes punicea]|nr:hypothetical protein BD414DRAFT_93369 [Trametes punicea]